MLVIPAIDLRNGSCVRLTQGSADTMKLYEEDPVLVAERFSEAGARIIHIVDLDGAFAGTKSPNRLIVERIVRRLGTPIQFGGGIRTDDDIKDLLEKGVSRIVLGTIATDLNQLESLIERFGESIAVGIDARGGQVMTRGWQVESGASELEFASRVAAVGVSRIIYTDISRDGMLSGPNIKNTVNVAKAANISVTASGGIGSLEDIEQLREAREPLIDSVIVGKALYEGRFTLEDAMQVATTGKSA